MKMGQRDRIDQIVDRLAEMPAVEKVDPLAEGICDRISAVQRRLMLRHKRSLDHHSSLLAGGKGVDEPDAGRRERHVPGRPGPA